MEAFEQEACKDAIQVLIHQHMSGMADRLMHVVLRAAANEMNMAQYDQFAQELEQLFSEGGSK